MRMVYRPGIFESPCLLTGLKRKILKTKWRCYENIAILGTLRLCFYCVFELPRIITVKENYRYERNKMFAMLYFKY